MNTHVHSRARSCDELGVCKSQTPRCTVCKYPYAIEHHRPTRSSARWLVRAGVFIAASACIGFVVGIFTGA